MSPTFYPYQPEEPDESETQVEEVDEFVPPLPTELESEFDGFTLYEEEEEEVLEPVEAQPTQEDQRGYRTSSSDPTFGLLVAGAVSVGMIPLLPENADLRYTVTWLALAFIGVLAWLLGNGERISQEEPENLVWGVVFAFLVGLPISLFGSSLLSRAVHLMFPLTSTGALLAYLVFVMPLAETLFFRGMFQQHREFWTTGIFATLWSMILFFPVLWGDLLNSPVVALTIAISFLMMNLIYSYVRDRNGLAAAWVCQIIVNFLVVFLPFL